MPFNAPVITCTLAPAPVPHPHFSPSVLDVAEAVRVKPVALTCNGNLRYST